MALPPVYDPGHNILVSEVGFVEETPGKFEIRKVKKNNNNNNNKFQEQSEVVIKEIVRKFAKQLKRNIKNQK